MFRLKCFPALVAALLNVFAGSLCCCSAGRLGQLLCVEGRAPANQPRCCCLRQTTVESNSKEAAQANVKCSCNCERGERNTIPAQTVRVGFAADWIATLDLPSTYAVNSSGVLSAVRAVELHPPIPPPCPLFIINATFLV